MFSNIQFESDVLKSGGYEGGEYSIVFTRDGILVNYHAVRGSGFGKKAKPPSEALPLSEVPHDDLIKDIDDLRNKFESYFKHDLENSQGIDYNLIKKIRGASEILGHLVNELDRRRRVLEELVEDRDVPRAEGNDEISL